MTSGDPYSASRIARGAAYLIVGKAVTSIAGIGTFLLLVRTLPVEEFAVYTVLFALVELVDAVTGFGLSHVLARYVPELFGGQRHRTLRRFVSRLIALRLLLLVLFLIAIYLLAPLAAPLVGLSNWEWALQAYLVVILARTTANTLFNLLESMLHQGTAQMGFTLVTLLRFLGFASAATLGSLDLQTVIAIEALTDLLGAGFLLAGTLRVMPKAGSSTIPDETGWITSNLSRMSDFGFKGYLQHMLVLPYGGATNRLLVGGALASSQVALFGFAQSISDLMERYLPMRMLAGITRPVLTARFVRDRRFLDLELAANLLFKINAIVVCAVAVVIFGGGKAMIEVITAGKYSEGSVGLLMAMCALVMMYSLRTMLDQVCHAVERNGPLVWSNIIIATSVLPGVALLPHVGVYALPVSNLVGLVLGCIVLVRRLHAGGFEYHHDMIGFGKMLAATSVGLGASELIRWIGGGWVTALIGAAVFFLVAVPIMRPWTNSERELVVGMVQAFRRKGEASGR